MAGQYWRRIKLVACLVAGCCLLAGSALALELGGVELSLHSTTKYQYQWSDKPANFMLNQDDSDQDLFETLNADARWAEHNLSFSSMMTYSKDLDGTRQGSIFQDYIDTRDHRDIFECYFAYLEKSGLFDDKLTIRAGRQYAYGAETIQFDGLWTHLDIPQFWNMEIEGFGGRAVTHYSHLGPKGIGGANLRIHPFSGLTAELNTVIFEETSWEGAVYWQPAENWNLRSRIAFINDHTRNIDLSLTTTIPATETTFDFSFFRRYAISSEADFLFDFTYTLDEALSDKAHNLYLMQEEGYLEFDARISQPIKWVDGLTLFVRYTNHSLADQDDENLYNSNFQRLSFGFDLDEGITWEGFHLSAGYSRWWEDRDIFYEEESSSWSVDVTQKFLSRFEVSAGYYHKTEDINSLTENEATTSWHSAISYKICNHSSIELEYEYDQSDYYEDELGVDHINSLTVSLDLDF